MSFHPDDESPPRIPLMFWFALMAVIIAVGIGTFIYQRAFNAPEPLVATTPAADMIADDESAVRVHDGVVKFYFAVGKTDVAIGGNVALAHVVRGVAYGKRAQISGFHDATGSPAANAELAKQRALAVHSTLLALGVEEDQVSLQKPEQTQASGSPEEARRVEVMLID